MAGNPFGAAAAGGKIGGIMVSSWRIAKALLTLASVSIVLASNGDNNGANAAAIAPANHGGATCSPANLWTTYQKTFELNE